MIQFYAVHICCNTLRRNKFHTSNEGVRRTQKALPAARNPFSRAARLNTIKQEQSQHDEVDPTRCNFLSHNNIGDASVAGLKSLKPRRTQPIRRSEETKFCWKLPKPRAAKNLVQSAHLQSTRAAKSSPRRAIPRSL